MNVAGPGNQVPDDATVDALADSLERWRERVERELDRWLPPESDVPERLHAAQRYSVLAPGKRIRPALVYATAETLGVPLDRVDAAACAVELIHCYSLVHDDLPAMDDDDLRRGRPTCHRAFDEATAILAGDALQALAFQVIADDASLAVETRIDLVSRLAKAAAKMVVGQKLDLEAEGRETSIEDIEQIHRNKTGALIRFSAEAGSVIGGADPDEITAISKYGERLGLLFQITDDLLDITRTTEELGKTAGKDVAADKATYPSLYGIEQTRVLASQTHREALAAIEPLGERAAILRQIAEFIVRRNA